MVLASSFTGIFANLHGGEITMRCLACDCRLSDREANRKYTNYQEIKNPEARYIMLCDDCILDTDLNYIEMQSLPEVESFDSEPEIFFMDNDDER
jgi:hypothetical protein